LHKKNSEKQNLLNYWFEAEYDRCVKAFRQTFGYDYQVKLSVEEELDEMNKDVKKAPMWQLKELVNYLKE
jgi:hypothetical protein